jgi:predicted aldo/keto reductase-like oxidoreductase
VHFTLLHPVSTVVIGWDNRAQVEENVQIDREFTPLSQTQMAALNDSPRRWQSNRSSSALLTAAGADGMHFELNLLSGM